MKDYKHILQSLGLTQYEAGIYICLLTNGPGSPSDIEQQTHIPRPTIYKSLHGLVQRDLVTITPKGKRKIYSAESPDRLVGIFKRIEEGFLGTIEELQTLKSERSSVKPTIAYSQGDRAIRHAYMDVIDSLDKGGTYYRYSPGYDLFDRKRFLPRKYEKVRDEKQLERYVIINDAKSMPKNRLGRDIRVLPKSFDLFEDQVSLSIYADKTVIMDHESASVITIKHSKFAEFQKKIFRLLYSKL